MAFGLDTDDLLALVRQRLREFNEMTSVELGGSVFERAQMCSAAPADFERQLQA